VAISDWTIRLLLREDDNQGRAVNGPKGPRSAGFKFFGCVKNTNGDWLL
jgi:hypothetical protein